MIDKILQALGVDIERARRQTPYIQRVIDAVRAAIETFVARMK